MDSLKEQSFTFPDCWECDMRMDYLFAPFKLRSVNPSNYDSKMSFWKCLIENWCLYQKTPFVSLPVLMSEFSRKNKSPSCLPEVINHLQRDKTLMSKDAFEQMVETNWAKWGMHVFIANPMKSTIKFIKNMVVTSNNDSGDGLLHLPVIKKLGEEVISSIHSISENKKVKLLNVKEIQETCGIRSFESLETVLIHLSSMKLIAICKCDMGILVKLPKQYEKDLKVTDVDQALYSLEENKKILEKNLDLFEEKRKQLIDKARKHVSAKNTSLAKASLKSSKVVEKYISKISNMITNIESLIYELHMAEIDSVVMDCYQVGSKSLRTYLEDNNLTKENIEKVRGELEDYLSLKADVDEAITSLSMSEIENEELDEELKKLLNEEGAPEELKLPDVPTQDPNNATIKELEERMIGCTM